MYTMNTCAFLLILSVQIYADGIEGPTGKTGVDLSLIQRSWEVFLPLFSKHACESLLGGKAERVW